MRILVLQDADWTKKGPHQQHHLMEMLSNRGHEIHVIGFDQLWRGQSGLVSTKCIIPKCNRFYDGASVKFIRSRFIRLPLFDYLSYAAFVSLDIDQEIEEFKPDVVISFTSIISSYWGAKKARSRGIPYIYYWTDVIHTLLPIGALRPIAVELEKRIMRDSTRILTINEVLKEKVVSIGANPASTLVLPGGTDLKRFDVSISGEDVRSKYGIGPEDQVLFFMGWIYHFSGLREVIQEMARNRSKCERIKLLIVGEGDCYAELRELVSKEKLEDKVIFTGLRPYAEIPQLVAASDICLLPAHCNEIMRDIVPIKLYEYLAMHKPIIVTKLPGVMKEFGDNSGLIYIGGPEEVIPTVLSLKPSDICAQQQKAMEFIKNYDWDILVTDFEKLLTSLVSET